MIRRFGSIAPCVIPYTRYVRSVMHQVGPNGKFLVSVGENGTIRHTKEKRLRDATAAVFVPGGYTEAPAPGYAAFSLWRVTQHTLSSALGVIATHSLFVAVGAGSAAIPAAAALNWVLKDGLGQLGTLIASRWFGHRVDVNPRMWYVSSAALLDVALGTELASPVMPVSLVVGAGAAATAFKGVAWLTAAASQAALLLSLSKQNNLADMYAKAGAQATAASIVGTAAGIAFAWLCGGDYSTMLGAYMVMMPFHTVSAYFAAKSVSFRKLSVASACTLAMQFVNKRQLTVPKRFPLLNRNPVGLRVDSLLSAVAPTVTRLQQLQQIYRNQQYLLIWQNDRALAVLKDEADSHACFQMCLQAAILYNSDSRSDEQLGKSLGQASESLQNFVGALATAGWHTSTVLTPEALRLVEQGQT